MARFQDCAEGAIAEFRGALRRLLRSPGDTFTAVATLSLGLGLTAAMFSIVHGVLLRGLPFPDAAHLLHLESSNPSQGVTSQEVTQHDFAEWTWRQTTFEGLHAFVATPLHLTGTEGSERFAGARISPGFLRTLRQEPLLGRGFDTPEGIPGAAPVILLGYRIWQDRYGGDPAILERTLRVDGVPAHVVGVMPEGFRFPVDQDLWMPLQLETHELPRGQGETLEVFGRLTAGSDLEQARADMARVAGHLAREFPDTNQGLGIVVKPYTEEFLGRQISGLLGVMAAAVTLVWLIALVNVTNLMLARVAGRRREMAVRSALGAGRLHMLTPWLAEALLICLPGCLLGTLLAQALVTAFESAIADISKPYWVDVRLEAGILLLLALLSALSAVLIAILPATRSFRGGLAQRLRTSGRGETSSPLGPNRLGLGRLGLARSLVVVEVALSCALLFATTLTVRSLTHLRTADLGFETEQALTLRLRLLESDYETISSRRAFFDRLLQELRAQPEVSEAAAANVLPTQFAEVGVYAVDGKPYRGSSEFPVANLATVTPGFFRALRVPLLAGRSFDERDRQGQPVAMVNESLARREWPAGQAVGKRLRLGRGEEDAPWLTVVGVVPDLYLNGIKDERPEGIYLPLDQSDAAEMSIVLATPGPPLALAQTVRRTVCSLDPDLPVEAVLPIERIVARGRFLFDLFGSLFIVFGAAAFLLAGSGLYSVLAAAVGNRTREIGLRLALGSSRIGVLALVLRQGLVQIALGTALGLPAALLLARGLRFLFFGVEATDPLTLLALPFFLALAGLAASLIPAHRAAAVDPNHALRQG